MFTSEFPISLVSHMKRLRRAWTLIEMLAAIAIVGVMAGILLPALSKSVSNARSVACVAAIKSYAQATHAYAADSKDFPPSATVVSPNGQLVWVSDFPTVRLPSPGGGQVQVRYPHQGWFSAYMLLDTGYLPFPAALCPTQKPQASLAGSPIVNGRFDEASRPNYAIPEVFYLNPRVYHAGVAWPNPAAALQSQRLTNVRHPASKVMIFEYRVWHLRGEPSLISALTSGRSGSVSTTDGGSRSWRLTGSLSRGTNSVWGYEHPSPWITPDGVRGVDLP